MLCFDCTYLGFITITPQPSLFYQNFLLSVDLLYAINNRKSDNELNWIND